jgi:hypothetical protein
MSQYAHPCIKEMGAEKGWVPIHKSPLITRSIFFLILVFRACRRTICKGGIALPPPPAVIAIMQHMQSLSSHFDERAPSHPPPCLVHVVSPVALQYDNEVSIRGSNYEVCCWSHIKSFHFICRSCVCCYVCLKFRTLLTFRITTLWTNILHKGNYMH